MLNFYGMVQILRFKGSRSVEGGAVWDYFAGIPVDRRILIPHTFKPFCVYKLGFFSKTQPEGVEIGVVAQVWGEIRTSNFPKYKLEGVFHNLDVGKIQPLFKMPLKVNIDTHLYYVSKTHRGYEGVR